MLPPISRIAAVLFLSMLCGPTAAKAQSLYQPIDMRQICGAKEILDAPAGRVIAKTKASTLVTMRDFGFGPNGRGYYRIDLHDGYVAVEDAPHFCIRPNEGALRAPPNTCHLIAASRRTLSEVNDFAQAYPAFLPTMSVYRSSNGWHAISLGIITLAAVGPLLENTEGLPPDSYCADGENYIAVLDQRDNIFFDPSDSPQAACLFGDRSACAARAEESAAASDLSQTDGFEALRYWMLACMGGAFETCSRPNVLTSAIYDHTLLTALPDADSRLGVMRDLSRTACDAGAVEGCLLLAGRELQFNTDTPSEYLTALQALTAACMADNEYACRDMFRLMERREKAMGTPVPTEDWYQAAQLRAATCRHDPAAGDEFACRPVYRAYTAFLDMVPADDDRILQVRDYLQTACERGNPEACPAPTAGDEFQRLSLLCKTAEPRDGADACGNALVFYARQISATDVGTLETMLQAACTSTRTAGCETLAFVYGTNTMTGQDVHFEGIDQPGKRLQALLTGCRPDLSGLPNCSDLAGTYEQLEQHKQASETYRMACETIREDSAAALYVRGHDACFDAGLHALRKLGDHPSARSYFEFVCNDPNQSEARYACKHLGLMARDGLGGPVDAEAAFVLFRQACYPTQAERGDGEGCLLYGNALRDNHDRIAFGFDGDLPTLGGTAPSAETRRMVEETASYTYARGCISRWEASCAANQAIIAERMAATDPASSVPCQLRSEDGRMLADRTCKHIRFFETAEVAHDERALVTTDIYIWPDGDRTLVQEQAGRWRLNGADADPYSERNDVQCLTSRDTGNSLCVTPPQ